MPDLSTFQAFIFDLDGTLLDSEKYHARAFAGAMLELTGYRLTEAEERGFSGNTSRGYSRELASRHGLSVSPDRVVARKFELLYRAFRAELFPGAREFLSHWHGRTRLAVASNSPAHFVNAALAEVDLIETFDAIITRDDVHARKPDPAMFLLALERLGVAPEKGMVFEDSNPGLGAALAAGCAVVILRNPGIDLPSPLAPEIPVLTWAELLAMPE